MTTLQDRRFWLRLAFFILFVVAPPLDIFRLDLNLGHFILFGQNWTLGLEAFQRGEISAIEAAINITLRGFIPIAIVVGLVIGVSYKYGRLYCGWLCPHFSVVEMINELMRRASGKLTIWDRHRVPEQDPDGRLVKQNPLYWVVVIFAVFGFAFLWAISLLTYMLPPSEIYTNLFNNELSLFQQSFLTAATIAFMVEFMFARHLFCRFACAVGLFQSLAWMANKKALVVGFQRDRVNECVSCNAACDNACPMRLKPRSIKRHMFTCTQCGQCLQACDQVQSDNRQGALINWVQHEAALDVSDREFGHGPQSASQSNNNSEER
ncbi:MAG: 4Fe-4S binding protein [Gammaproteobacteria bacterium]|nr:4Fe-4S binding protein [Gammaproteobacteria bacterium]